MNLTYKYASSGLLDDPHLGDPDAMNPSSVNDAPRMTDCNDFVSSDFSALASHMNDCQRSRSRFFTLRSALETLHSLTAPRLVTTGAVLLICSFVLVGLGLLAVV